MQRQGRADAGQSTFGPMHARIGPTKHARLLLTWQMLTLVPTRHACPSGRHSRFSLAPITYKQQKQKRRTCAMLTWQMPSLRRPPTSSSLPPLRGARQWHIRSAGRASTGPPGLPPAAPPDAAPAPAMRPLLLLLLPRLLSAAWGCAMVAAMPSPSTRDQLQDEARVCETSRAVIWRDIGLFHKPSQGHQSYCCPCTRYACWRNAQMRFDFACPQPGPPEAG